MDGSNWTHWTHWMDRTDRVDGIDWRDRPNRSHGMDRTHRSAVCCDGTDRTNGSSRVCRE